MLQTAQADVFNIETKSAVKTRILFDTGRQRCYVTVMKNSLKKTLINTFGQTNDFKMQV